MTDETRRIRSLIHDVNRLQFDRRVLRVIILLQLLAIIGIIILLK